MSSKSWKYNIDDVRIMYYVGLNSNEICQCVGGGVTVFAGQSIIAIKFSNEHHQDLYFVLLLRSAITFAFKVLQRKTYVETTAVSKRIACSNFLDMNRINMEK